MNKYVATFGANQPNEGHYILINAKTHSDAVEYMNREHDGIYCMIYSLDHWIDWVIHATKIGLMVETELMEVHV